MNRAAHKKLKPEDLRASIDRGVDFLISLQREDGSWQGDYGGPMFLLPMYIGLLYITGTDISEKLRRGFLRYYTHVINEDGSVGIHPEAPGYMFTTTLAYAALRIIGLGPDEPVTRKMRAWITANGGPAGAASWGKFFLYLLNLYPREGLVPLLPELWSLPYALPIHPARLWCHARQVYLPMAYLYGTGAVMPENNLISALREELYNGQYSSINFKRARNSIAAADNYRPYGPLLRAVNRIQVMYEAVHPRSWRRRSLKKVYLHIQAEDRATHFIDIGPVNKIYNTLAHFYTDPGGDNYRKSMEQLPGYLSDAEDGIKMNGYNSTALWDTAFSAQTLSTPAVKKDTKTAETLARAYRFIAENQVTEDVPDRKRFYRSRSRGGWPFSDKKHGWPITDCTAEGFHAALEIAEAVPVTGIIADDMLQEAIELILDYQNSDGGWATYERRRGGRWLERLNPSSVFGEIMIDYSYVECTSSCLQALARARGRFNGKLDSAITASVRRGIQFILKSQQPDGSFYGSWAVCYTYGTWFGVWGLIEAGLPEDAPEITRAVDFLLAHQNADGGWGESYKSCMEQRWVYHEKSQAVQTAWALLALIKAGRAGENAVERGISFLVQKQMKNGDWPRESLVGMFNKTVLINYENYRRYFPVRALSLYINARRNNNTTIY